jgi:hypothetical protein
MVTPEMLSYFSEHLAANASRGLINRVADVKLLIALSNLPRPRYTLPWPPVFAARSAKRSRAAIRRLPKRLTTLPQQSDALNPHPHKSMLSVID